MRFLMLGILAVAGLMCGLGCSKHDPVELVRKAAEQGDAAAQCEFGICCYTGIGVEKNPVEAVKWWRKAAEQGDLIAQYDLGHCYAKGDGVGQDLNEAIRWYRKAAEKGNADAKKELAKLAPPATQPRP